MIRTTCIWIAAALAITVNAQALRTRVGFMNFDLRGGGEKLNTEALEHCAAAFKEIGAYEVYTQADMEASFAELKIRFPEHCSEPRCITAIGSSLQMDRMVYGNLDKNEKTYGLRLTMVDVPSRQVIERVTLEGEAGVALADVMQVAVYKLHGQVGSEVDTVTRAYFGPEVNNLRQLAVSAPACILGGLIWAAANNGLKASDNNDYAVSYDYSGLEADLQDLFGVATGADLIPLFGRAGAMGNAYTAASDDAYGIFFNPAGLSWVPNGEVAFGYQRRFGLDNFAGSFVNKATREIGFGQGVFYSGDREGIFSEMHFISGISYKFNRWISFFRPISAGVAVKLITQRAKSDMADASTGTGFGAGLDLGALWELAEHIRYGVTVKNVPALMRWNNTATDTTYFEYRQPTLHMGGLFAANYATVLTCEGRIPLNEDQRVIFAGGVERLIFGVFKIRAGIEKEAYFDTPWRFTAGFGFDANTESFVGKRLAIDGSYEYNTLDVFAHVVNASFRFGF